ncbi:hypothetical protein HMF8227_00149 [Saliniradius amylolyticus]|uniref:Solute-binding protein family 3/N-terminal domain-containing protein n=1 Tax=Saliniradius amylolyticus TaxID=2183582 RepID=A0A2S2E0V9_9ALTE|nr:transporter substrate-binding domain-containing protein [Saliniradius amylolyticus]AWL10657.1 hypothetical protein HMF8227_00149 [Saliniradius amylolyticus]
MRLVLGLFLFCCHFLSSAEPDGLPQITVDYRDYQGSHEVEGRKTAAHTYLFNEDARTVLKLATLNWSPYIAEKACEKGWVFQTAVALLHRQGYGAQITFYPWARAITLVESGKADILFPEYFIEPEASSDVFPGTRRLDHLTLSHSFGAGPIAFIKRRGYDTSHYKNLISLKDEFIGVVRGYQNTPEFDRLMEMGTFNVVEALSDLNNVELLLNNRVNLIIGDPKVVREEIRLSDYANEEKVEMLATIETVKPILRMNKLFFAISKHRKDAKKLKHELNQAIDSFKRQGVINNIQYRWQRHCLK